MSSEIITTLNARLSEEIVAIIQYTTHSACAENWGLPILAKYLMDTAKVEMGHSHELMDRIFALDEVPVVTLGEVKIGKDVKEIVHLSAEAEEEAIEHYNESIIQAHDLKDNSSKKIFESNELDEQKHYDFWEAEEYKIDQMGLELFLSTLI